MTTTQTPEASVMFSLAELSDLEEERLREEQVNRAASRRERERASLLEQEAKRRVEAAQVAAEAERRAQHERERAAHQARELGRQQVAAEVARIEAESKARLQADNAVRGHEIELLRVKEQGGRARLQWALGVVVGLVVMGGAGGGWVVSDHLAGLEQQSQRLRDDRFALRQAHDETMASELASLDARHLRLRERASTPDAEQARLRAEAARTAIEAGGVDSPKLGAFSGALDQLDAVVRRIERVAALDRRMIDLARWARASKKTALLDAAKHAAGKAHTSGVQDEAMTAYAGSLDQLADTLAMMGRKGPRARPPAPGTRCGNRHDPMCGLDGTMLGDP